MRANWILLSVSVPAMLAQQPASAPPAGARLVEVTVSVLDKKGEPVTDLTAQDFTAGDAGKGRPIALFRHDGAKAAPAAEVRLPRGVYTNCVPAARNATAVLIDSLNTPQADMQMAKAQAVRYLKALGPGTRVGVFHLGREFSVLHGFSSDAAAFRERLAEAARELPLVETQGMGQASAEADQLSRILRGGTAAGDANLARLDTAARFVETLRLERMEVSAAGLETLGRHMAGFAGRKSIVWIGAGLSLGELEAAAAGGKGGAARGSYHSYELRLRAAAERLAQQGIAVYVVDSTGVRTRTETAYTDPVRTGRASNSQAAYQSTTDTRPAGELFANITGGRYLYNSAGLTSGFRKALADLQGSYTVGFYLPEDADGKWHRLKIQVKRPGANVRHREGYLAEAAGAPLQTWNENQWKAALANPVASSAVPLTVQCGKTETGELSLTILIDAAGLLFRSEDGKLKSDLRVAIADAAGQGIGKTQLVSFTAAIPQAQWDEVRAQGIPYQRTWKPAENAASVRIAVLDARTGQYGTIEVPVKDRP